MMKLKFCYCGDSVIYNDLIDEFYGPLEKCSEGSYHTFIVDSNYYVVNPRTSISGEFRAKKIAMVSSIPGSVSIIIF